METSNEPIVSRISRLNQVFLGKSNGRHVVNNQVLLSREGLLDALFVLYEECNNEHMMKNEHISSFVTKFKSTISELRQLRIGISDFEVKKVIGRGHFGDVQVVREKQTGDVYAMKTLRKSETLAQQNVAFYEEERDIMAKANSPWITQLMYAFQDSHMLYLIMEFHPGGDLLSLLGRYDDIFQEDMARFYLAEIANSIHALHNMGYVHRDVKPENILIDRTGHMKLADFGSAAKLSAQKIVTSKMPVGTPDYIAPEVLMSMNSDKNIGTYGIACDWWSLGIVAYEMLYGKTPFTDEKCTAVATYSNIMDYKKTLSFPNDVKVGDESISMIKGLLSAAETRLGYEKLCKHRFFAQINFSNIRHTRPPFIPTVTSQDDCSNFDDFEILKEAPKLDDFKTKRDFSGKDLPFIGFTYTKPLPGTERLSSTASDVSSPAVKNNFEHKLTTKTKELLSVKEKCIELESDTSTMKSEVEKLKAKLKEKDALVAKVENERNILERDMAAYITEVTSLKRLLELEKQERVSTDNKAMQLLNDIREQASMAQKLREENNRAELDEHREIISQLEADRHSLTRKVETMEKEMKKKKTELNEWKMKANEFQSKLSKVKDSTKRTSNVYQNQLEEEKKEYQARETELQIKVQKLTRQNFEATEYLQKIRKEKESLEDKLADLQRKGCGDVNLKQKLIEAEDKLQALDSKLRRASQAGSWGDSMKKELTEKSKHVQQLAEKIADLEEELRDKEIHYQNQAKLFFERQEELQGKIQDLETHVADLQDNNRKLEVNASICVETNEDNGMKVEEQQKAIEILKNNVAYLEKQNKELKSEMYKLPEYKEARAIKVGEISDLNQEKKYFETKIENLMMQIEQLKTRGDYNRKRVIEVQSEMQEEYIKHTTEMKELKIRLTVAEKLSDGVKLRQAEWEATEKTLRNKIEEQQKEIKRLNERLAELKKDLSEKSKQSEENITKAETEKRKAELKCNSMKDSVSDLERQIKRSSEQNMRLESELQKMKDEVQEHRIQSDMTEKRYKQLKEVCLELESQIQDMEELNMVLEEKERQWNSDRLNIEVTVKEREQEADKNWKALHMEKQSKQVLEKKYAELNTLFDTSTKTHKLEIETLNMKLKDHSQKSTHLNKALSELEHGKSNLELKVKNLQRKVDALEDENVALKEESSALITTNKSLKSTNFKLSQGLEEAVEKGEILKADKEELENQLENAQVSHTHEKFKLEITINQQTKLIDYLQDKTENQTKKKKGIFSTPAKSTPSTGMSMQLRDLQSRLEQERSKNAELRAQIAKLQKELYDLKNGSTRSKTPATPVSTLSRAPSLAYQFSPSDLLRSQAEGNVNTPKPKRDKRFQHNIPHRFTTGLNTRARQCAVCLGTVPFVKQASKCQECNIVCHPRCAPSMPSNCGMPTKYMEHFAELMARKSVSSITSAGSFIGVQMDGWLKIPRSGNSKQGWEKKWVVLEDSKLYIYNDENTLESPCDEFDLCPIDGGVKVQTAVSAAELSNIATTDLAYVFRLDFIPHTTCWPGRVLYLMAPSFPEKQKWIATLEAIITGLDDAGRMNRAKLLGNIILTLADERRIDVNCTLLINDKLLLIGAEEGLFAHELLTMCKGTSAVKVEGMTSVYQMQHLEEMGLVIMIRDHKRRMYMADFEQVTNYASLALLVEQGQDRHLSTVDYQQLKNKAHEALPAKTATITLRPINGVQGCTVFDSALTREGTCIVVAMPTKVAVLKYSSSTGEFNVRKEIPTSDPASCIHICQGFAIVGTDRFYRLNLSTYGCTDFIDKSDRSLAFVAYGAASFDSFPIEVCQISATEYLLCYSEFGVFVNEKGHRSRSDDLKWHGLPLAFGYREPYLFVTHFNSLQVIEITESGYGEQTSIDIPSPRYLGPAVTGGAVYIGSMMASVVEIFCFKGNLGEGAEYMTTDTTETSESECKENVFERPSRRRKSPLKTQMQTITPSRAQRSGFVSPTKPVTRSSRRNPRLKPVETSSDSADSDTTSLSSYDGPVGSASVSTTLSYTASPRTKRVRYGRATPTETDL